MLGLGVFPQTPSLSLHSTAPLETLSLSLSYPTRTHQTHVSFLSNGLTHHAFCPILARIRKNLIFCVSAATSRRKGGNTHTVINNLEDGKEFDDEFDDEIDDEEEEDEEGGEEEEDEFIPLKNMKEWYANKPRGFGEGKVYDTSIEEKLAAEIEKSRKALLANINKLKNSPQTSKSSKEVLQKQRAPEDVPSGIRVRVVNLPKKRNIHRDLKLAFKGVPGIVDVIPAVSGNKKTRDPICKGFAFVDLKSEVDANRFVKSFSRQSITFGKLQKQVRCEIIKSPSSPLELTPDGNDRAPHMAISSLEESPDAKFERVNDTSCEIINSKSPTSPLKLTPDGNDLAPHVAISSFRESPNAKFDGINDTSSDSYELTAPDDSEDEDFEHVPAEWEEVGGNLESFSLSKHTVGESLGTRTESVSNSMPSKQKEKVPENGKKLKAKRKRTIVPKLKIPGSTNRLRVKEKAVLTGAFSKYAAQAASASKEKP